MKSRQGINNHWQQRKLNQKYWDFKNLYHLNDFVASMLSANEFLNENDITDFLDPKIKNTLQDPFLMKDVSKAVDFIIKSIKNNEKIAIFADYDVDGACSAAILSRFLNNFDLNPFIYVPDRFKEGYGPNPEAFLKLKKEQNVSTIITVDCGIVAFDSVKIANENGLNIIILDHHKGCLDIPDAIAVVNPNRLDDTSGYNYLCGAGVVFMICVALLKVMKEKKIFQNNIEKVKLMEYVDILSVATICDMVPLVSMNRAFVKTGLKLLKNTSNLALENIMKLKLIDTNYLNSESISFGIGPVINAGGRIGESSIAALSMASNNKEFVEKSTKELLKYNEKRVAIEREVYENVVKTITDDDLKSKIIFKFGKYNEGVIGIAASKVKEKFALTTIIGSLKKGIIKTSCRSSDNVDIGKIVLKAVDLDLLIKGGGHARAAGFSLEFTKLDKFIDFLHKEIKQSYLNITETLTKFYNYSCYYENLNEDFINDYEMLEPFGISNLQPIIKIMNISVLNFSMMKDVHLRLNCRSNKNKEFFSCVLFYASDTKILEFLKLKNFNKIDSLIVKISINFFNNKKRLNLFLVDLICR